MSSPLSPFPPRLPAALEGCAPATRMIHGGTVRSSFDETSEAMFLNSGFVYGSAEEAEAAFSGDHTRYVYSRFRNPTVCMFEERLAQLEEAPAAFGPVACRATASGMAAVFAALACQLKAGDRVVASRALFGSCTYILKDILPHWGVETLFVEGGDLNAWATALEPGAAAVFFETPSNPGVDLVDIEAVSRLAHAAGACVVVDNVFATPLLQSPLMLGADVVAYSATKHMDGQGRCLGGAVVGRADFINDVLGPFLRNTGPSLSPFNAWTLLKGLETLTLRIPRHCDSALALATALESHPALERVRYPWLASHPSHALAKRQMRGGGGVLSLDLVGGKAAAFRFLNRLRLVSISNNLGDAKSLACHPFTTTHQRLSPEDKALQGIGEGLVRLSVGLEDPQDLLRDLVQALEG